MPPKSSHPWILFFDEIQALEKKFRRSITTLAVSKGQGIKKIESALMEKNFPRILGESYLEEGLQKISQLKAYKLEWHFIGRLQSRKIPEIARAFSCLHGVSRQKELEAIAKHTLGTKFFLQVNTSGESQKNGFLPTEVSDALQYASNLGVREQILGLMTLPAPVDEVGEESVRAQFKTLKKIRDEFLPTGLLNMGTSGDYRIAIEEGADWIRIGTRLFGEREDSVLD
jgi:PLP dependent protein